MKRLLLILSIVLLSMPLFAKVTIGDSVPREYRDVLEKSLLENLRGRGLDAAVDTFVLDESESLASFSIVLGEKILSSTVPMEMVGTEIRNMLFYEESLKSEGETLNYVWNSSFSFCPEESYRVGETLCVLDQDQTVRGLFYVDKVYPEGVLLKPFYLDDPLPGMRLERKLPLDLRFSFGSSLDLQTFSLEARASYSALVYPVFPTVSLVLDTGKHNAFGLGIGVQMDLSFASFLPSSPAIVRNTSLVGNAEFIMGTELQGRFTLGLENRVNSHFFYGASFVCYELEKFGVALLGGYAI